MKRMDKDEGMLGLDVSSKEGEAGSSSTDLEVEMAKDVEWDEWDKDMRQ